MIYFYIYIAIGLVIVCGIYLQHIDAGKEWAQPNRSGVIYLYYFRVIKPIVGICVVVSLWPLLPIVFLWSTFIESYYKEQVEASPPPQPRSREVNKEELIERLTVAEIEMRELVSDPMGAVQNVPFGHCNAPWKIFKATILPEDEVWSFAIQTEVMKKGYAIVRDGVVASHILTEVS